MRKFKPLTGLNTLVHGSEGSRFLATDKRMVVNQIAVTALTIIFNRV